MKRKISDDMKSEADKQMKKLQEEISYDTKDYTVELLVQKFNNGDFFIPAYQRKFIWTEKNKSLFIESVILGLPIPFMFFADTEDGRLEIIDGAQRIQTLVNFVNGQIRLLALPKLTKLKGFSFNDFDLAQQRRFLNRALRLVVLEESTPSIIRQDIFNRINTTGQKAKESEIRRGSYPGPLTEFIEDCTKNPKFIKLCPVSERKNQRYERFELVLRFFTYLNEYPNFRHVIKDFLDDFLQKNMKSFDRKKYNQEFQRMLDFVEVNLPCGFAKSITATTTPRVRFEAIAVGVALALRENPNLQIPNVNFLKTERFKELTTSDASNNTGKLRERIEFVKNWLLDNGIRQNE